MCRDRVIGEAAIVADAEYAVVRVLRSDMDADATATLTASCDTCTDSVDVSATVSIHFVSKFKCLTQLFSREFSLWYRRFL